MNNFNEIEEKIGYEFKDKSLIQTALTHISYSNEKHIDSYERLEFLGDAVVELIVSDFIFSFKELDCGILSKLRAGLVSTDYLSNISIELGLVELVKKSKSLNKLSKKNTADLFESLIGAIYLDGGIYNARKIVEKYVIISVDNVQNVLKSCVDYKTRFQEDMQKVGKKFEYKLLNSTGLAHDMTFECGLFIENELISKAIGKSIQLAQEGCAKKYYEFKDKLI